MNPYLNFKEENEQDLMESLIIEAIDMHAEQFYYIPRQLVSPDDILGEDRLSKFKGSYPFTAYFENITNFDGQGAFIQRFGGLLDYSATLILPRRHWQQFIGQYGVNLLPNRPTEGDWIYYPLTDAIFEIKYVDDKNPFAQLGAFFVYKLTIELAQYSSEEIDSDIDEIDAFATLKTFDIDPDKSIWGAFTEIKVLDGGDGYKETPELCVQSITGHGAQFEIEMFEGSIKDIVLIDGGEGYAEDDKLCLIGDCKTPAHVSYKIRTQIENAGDAWGTNRSYEKESDDYLVDFENPFGGKL